MDRQKIEILNKNTRLADRSKFNGGSELSKNEVEKAIETAVDCLKRDVNKYIDGFAGTASGWYPSDEVWSSKTHWSVNRYKKLTMPNWESGMWTGLYWMIYELTGDKAFYSAAQSQVKIFERVAKEAVTLNDHDTGFKYSPSCVAAYKITGDTKARDAALRAAEIQLEHYCPINNFLICNGTRSENDPKENYRTLVDSMLNIPLFFWAYTETGNPEFYEAGTNHYNTTLKYLIRDDGSSYHHYLFDADDFKPIGGLTWQGHRDESCWSRGQSWLIFGYPTAYGYTQDKDIFDVHRAVSYYFLNNLPSDMIPYWDFDFNDGSLEPRDSSAAAIATAGLMEMCKYLDESNPDKALYKNAAGCMLKAMIDKCANNGDEGDGILLHATGARPLNSQVNTVETYGDYFYMESLMRWLKPDWKAYW